MKTKNGFTRLVVMCAMMCLGTLASAIDDPNDLPELFDGTRQQTCCSVSDMQETGDGGLELAE